MAWQSGAVERLRGFPSPDVLLRMLMLHVARGYCWSVSASCVFPGFNSKWLDYPTDIKCSGNRNTASTAFNRIAEVGPSQLRGVFTKASSVLGDQVARKARCRPNREQRQRGKDPTLLVWS